jgi:hypothetical protein
MSHVSAHGTDYQAPTPMFTTCPTCGGLCLQGQGMLLTPALGYPHVCEPPPGVNPEETLP